ncbi:hypothetical protein [Reinekea sp. G2M2-21]|nr:hypothetical protein [Reinekea sp. G2M2-21]
MTIPPFRGGGPFKLMSINPRTEIRASKDEFKAGEKDLHFYENPRAVG